MLYFALRKSFNADRCINIAAAEYDIDSDYIRQVKIHDCPGSDIGIQFLDIAVLVSDLKDISKDPAGIEFKANRSDFVCIKDYSPFIFDCYFRIAGIHGSLIRRNESSTFVKDKATAPSFHRHSNQMDLVFQIRSGIYRYTINYKLKVQVTAIRSSGIAYQTDLLPLNDCLSFGNVDFRKVSVDGNGSVCVNDLDIVSVGIHRRTVTSSLPDMSSLDSTSRCSDNGRSFRSRIVDSMMSVRMQFVNLAVHSGHYVFANNRIPQ